MSVLMVQLTIQINSQIIEISFNQSINFYLCRQLIAQF